MANQAVLEQKNDLNGSMLANGVKHRKLEKLFDLGAGASLALGVLGTMGLGIISTQSNYERLGLDNTALDGVFHSMTSSQWAAAVAVLAGLTGAGMLALSQIAKLHKSNGDASINSKTDSAASNAADKRDILDQYCRSQGVPDYRLTVLNNPIAREAMGHGNSR